MVLSNFLNALEKTRRPVLFLAHKRIWKKLDNVSFDREQITITEFVSYYNTLRAMKNCEYLMSDSGTWARESYFLGKRCLARQNSPYWPVLSDEGAHRLIGQDLQDMLDGITWAEDMKEIPSPKLNDFGDGNAVRNILSHLRDIGGKKC